MIIESDDWRNKSHDVHQRCPRTRWDFPLPLASVNKFREVTGFPDCPTHMFFTGFNHRFFTGQTLGFKHTSVKMQMFLEGFNQQDSWIQHHLIKNPTKNAEAST
jgi:hypothetical protein